MDLLLILNGTSRCLRNPRLPEHLRRAAGTTWLRPGGRGRMCCILTLWFTDTPDSGQGVVLTLLMHSPHPVPPYQVYRCSCSFSCLSCQHLERVWVSVKLSAPLSVCWEYFLKYQKSSGMWEWTYLAFSMCMRRSWDATSNLLMLSSVMRVTNEYKIDIQETCSVLQSTFKACYQMKQGAGGKRLMWWTSTQLPITNALWFLLGYRD